MSTEPTVGAHVPADTGRYLNIDCKPKPEPTLPNAEARLKGALDTICGDRQAEYGHPRDNIGNVATLWSAITGYDISARQVCKMMIAMKLSRDINAEAKNQGRAKTDNEVDIIGYTALMSEVDA